MKVHNIVGVTIFLFVSIVYLATLEYRPYPYSFLVKSIPIFTLMILVYQNIRNSAGKRLSIGLLCSAIGDILLALPSSHSFVLGIIAFSIAHAFYISVFLKGARLQKSRLPVMVAMAAYSVILAAVMVSGLGAMMIPVMGYLLVILVMGFSAALGEKNHTLIIIGACFFIVSDSLIAINGFINPIPRSSLWIMITYYIAQAMIAFGSFKSFAGD